MAKLKIYIVEDSPVIRENLIATLEELAPVEVVGTADNESVASFWLGRHPGGCDLLIVDIFLKSGSGLGVISSAQVQGRTTKVVVLSNYATTDMRRKCLALGADRVFDKSHEIDSLVHYCIAQAQGGDAVTA